MRVKNPGMRSGVIAVIAAPWVLVIWAVTWVTGVLWPRSFWFGSGLPGWANAVIAGIPAALAVFTILRAIRSGSWLLRRDLARLARQRRGGTWLNRDEHQAFTVSSRYRILLVNRIAEDDVLALHGEPGENPLALETFVLFPGVCDVIRHDQAILVNPEAETVRKLPGTPGAFRTLWRLHRAARTGFGFVTADSAEIAGLVGQLRHSERVEDG